MEALIPWLVQLMRDPAVSSFVTVLNLLVLVNVYQEVRRTNGRLIRLEAWKDSHEKQDEDRHKEVVGRLASLQGRRTS